MSKPCEVVPFADVDGRCDLCGKWLVGQQRVWCSRKCQRLYRSQHRWNLARAAARRRDGYRCRHCGTGRENPTVRLEVNHIEPRLGKGYGWGCAHHLANLETLCHDCHLVVTRAQRALRKVVQHAA